MRKVTLKVITALIIIFGIPVALFYALNHKPIAVAFSPLVYPGFSTWPSPRDFDGPGTVFTLNKDYYEFQRNLNVEIVKAGNETLVNIFSTAQWEESVLASFIKVNKNMLHLNSTEKYTVNISLNDVERWRVDPDKVKKEIFNFPAEYYNEPLYIIMEAISVKKIHFEVIGSNNHASKGIIVLTQDNNTKATIDLTNTHKCLIDKVYDKPHYIFFRANEIKRFQGVNESEVFLVDLENNLLEWKNEKR